MKEWKEYKLGEIAEIINERTSINNASLENYISTENMINDFGGVRIAEKLPTSNSINTFQESDILFSNIRTYFKKVWYCSFSGTVSPDVIVFRAKNCDSRYLYYQLCNPEFTEYTVLTSKGAKMPRGDKDAIKNFNTLLPPLPEQKAIAEVLSSLDDKIDLLHQQNETLEAMAETLFRQWFVEEAKEDWEEGKLGDLIEVKYGKDHKKLEDGKVPVYGSGGLMRYAEKALFNGESVLVPRKGSLNNVMYKDEQFWTVDTMFYTEMKVSNIAKFVYYFLKNQDLASMNVGSAVPSMTTDILRNMPLNIPSDDTLKKFERAIIPLFKKKKDNQAQTRTLTQLRDTLLPKFMSGEVRVNTI